MRERFQQLQTAYEAAGQEQVFAFWKKLTPTQRDGLIEDAAAVDLKELGRLWAQYSKGSQAAVGDMNALMPAPFEPVSQNGGDPKRWAQAERVGKEAISQGRVACFTVAGGQGTRLGYDGPKGAFPCTVLRKKSLFEIFAEKIRAARMRYGAAIPWFIMTSRHNHDQTLAFFREHKFFGLGELNVHFFSQGLMPVVDFNGKILLESPDRIALSPDGHGGSLRAMVRSGAIDKMKEMGVDLLSYFQVDNPLIHCVDPAFVGWHLLGNSQFSSKALVKTDPLEKVGAFCMQNGKMSVIEYSDLSDELAQKRGADGKLEFAAGSIAIHIINRELIESLGGAGAQTLPFHFAKKKAEFVGKDGELVFPKEPNAVKFEMFVFDAIGEAKNPIVIETVREEEFSPIKNAQGVDSPQSSLRDQQRQAARWLIAAGCDVPVDKEGVPLHPIEISPLFADSAEALLEKKDMLQHLDFSKPLYLGK